MNSHMINKGPAHASNINALARSFTPTCFSASRRHLQGVQCEPAELLPKVLKAEQNEAVYYGRL
jgi:hypothetical protein